MAQDMHGHSWRSRVAAHLAPVKEYLPHHGHLHIHHHHNPPTETGYVDGDAKKHSWSHLASRMFARRSYSDPDATTSTERVVLLPGWASRRYRAGPELSSRTGASCRFLFKGEVAHGSQVPRTTLRCLFLAMSSSTRPTTPCHVPNGIY